MGLVQPQLGAISIAGLKPEKYFTAPGVALGYVGAEPYLIHGTVRENLLYGNTRNIDDSEIFEMLKKVQLGSWFNSLKSPLEHALSENGEGLSTGQKQRLMFARALLRKPQVLILDEISANLDTATEAELASLMSTLRGQCTTVVVSHRPGLIRNIDNRLILGGDHNQTGEDSTGAGHAQATAHFPAQ
jgi:ABC-type multidrug transport system fused ATPase/permease subunit